MDDDTHGTTALLAPSEPLLTQSAAHDLGRQLQSCAADQATLDARFCDLVDEFDSSGALRWFQGVKSVAHYLSWACSMSGGASREHVRVARALRAMPLVKQHFHDGRFSYSKVRELTRIAGLVDEAALCRLALEMTASQLARTVASYRLAAGTRLENASKRRLTRSTGPDGMVRFSIVVHPDEAALLTAAIESSVRQTERAQRVAALEPSGESRAAADRQDRPELDDLPEGIPSGRGDRVQALLDIASHFLSAPASPSNDDHTLVVVQVSAEQLAATPAAEDVPAGTSQSEGDPTESVPAGTSLQTGTCLVEGQGAVEVATAQRLACSASLLPVVVDASGDVLTLGRTARLATRAQRRALRVRDRAVCQFPGCSQMTHLDAHHRVPWSAQGRTDLDNLVLLCRRHHVCVHEGGIRLEPVPRNLIEPGSPRFRFVCPDGTEVTERWSSTDPDDVDRALLWKTARAQRWPDDARGPSSDPTRIFPPHAGAGFSLHECVAVLFAIELPPPPDDVDPDDLTTAA